MMPLLLLPAAAGKTVSAFVALIVRTLLAPC
jgi:hypothetical protein